MFYVIKVGNTKTFRNIHKSFILVRIPDSVEIFNENLSENETFNKTELAELHFNYDYSKYCGIRRRYGRTDLMRIVGGNAATKGIIQKRNIFKKGMTKEFFSKANSLG